MLISDDRINYRAGRPFNAYNEISIKHSCRCYSAIHVNVALKRKGQSLPIFFTGYNKVGHKDKK